MNCVTCGYPHKIQTTTYLGNQRIGTITHVTFTFGSVDRYLTCSACRNSWAQRFIDHYFISLKVISDLHHRKVNAFCRVCHNRTDMTPNLSLNIFDSEEEKGRINTGSRVEENIKVMFEGQASTICHLQN